MNLQVVYLNKTQEQILKPINLLIHKNLLQTLFSIRKSIHCLMQTNKNNI